MNNLLSVITVCYNSRQALERTFYSVLDQTYADFEYIIIDDGSKDGTLELIESFKEKFYRKGIDFKYISERDNGIYHAMNKGILMAQNKYIQLVNAGEVYTDPAVLEYVVKTMADSKHDIYFGDAFIVDGYIKKYFKSGPIENIKKYMAINHESTFVKKEVYVDNLYAYKYKIASDYELMLKLYLKGYSFCHIPLAVIVFFTDGISSKKSTYTYVETQKIRIENGVLTKNPHNTKDIKRTVLRIKLYYEIMPCWLRAVWELLVHKNYDPNSIYN